MGVRTLTCRENAKSQNSKRQKPSEASRESGEWMRISEVSHLAFGFGIWDFSARL
jgi:hypothetical protein